MNTLKHSRQRDAVLKVLQGTKSHPTAEWIYERVKRDNPSVSLATVYRNLKQLTELGAIMKFEAGTGKEHYDACTEAHYHFVCRSCSAVKDADLPVIPFDKIVSIGNERVYVDSHHLILYGLCEKCYHCAKH